MNVLDRNLKFGKAVQDLIGGEYMDVHPDEVVYELAFIIGAILALKPSDLDRNKSQINRIIDGGFQQGRDLLS